MLSREQQETVKSLMVSADKIANKLCSGDEEAKSVAYLALCEAVSQYRDGAASIKTYCLRFVKRAVQEYRGEKYGSAKRKKIERVFLTKGDATPQNFTGFEQVEIDDLLRVLRPTDREIFWKVVFENVSVASVAKERGCSMQTIYNILKRCKARLRREIDGQPSSDTSSRV